MTLGQLVQLLAPYFQIVSSVGVLLGIVTAILGLRRYLEEKQRDREQQNKDYLAALRRSIYISRPIFEELNHLLKYEYFYEMASHVARSTPVSTMIDDVYDLMFKAIRSDADPYRDFQQINTYMESLSYKWPVLSLLEFTGNGYNWPDSERKSASTFVSVPLRTKLAELFKNNTSRIGIEIEPYRFDYPVLSRVLLSANLFFKSLDDKYTRHVRNGATWREAIESDWKEQFYYRSQRAEQVNVVEQGPARELSESEEQPSVQEQSNQTTSGTSHEQVMIPTSEDLQFILRSPDQFKEHITQSVVSTWYTNMYSPDADTIDAVLEIVQIVTRTYLAKEDGQLLSIGEREKKAKFAPLEQTPQPEQMLQEVFDGLKPILTEFDWESYHDLARIIGQRNSHRS